MNGEISKTLKKTYPIPELEENYGVITQTYNLLNEHLKLGIDIHPAGEWILDNYYLIEETVKIIKKDLPLKKYLKFVGTSNKKYLGYAKIYALALKIVEEMDSRIEPLTLVNYLKDYQTKDNLDMEEIWNIPIFLQIAIIENIREICEQIFLSQIQRYKVENIVERLIDNAPKEEQKYRTKVNYKLNHMPYSFIEYMSYKLKVYGKQTHMFLQILEEQVEKSGYTIEEIVKREHIDMAHKKVLIGNCIKSIKDLLRFNFEELFENINIVEDILKRDPTNEYINMDYKTKAFYKTKLKQIATKTKLSEIYVAKKVLELAQKGEGKKAHIGYYLILKEGIVELLNLLQNKHTQIISNNNKVKLYILAIWGISLLLSIWLNLLINISNIVIRVIGIFLILIPIQEIVKNVIQYILTKKVPLQLIPKLDLQGKVPEEMATFVVIPTIIKDCKKTEELIKKLEVFYLANKSENIYFGLLGDVLASSCEKEDYDKDVINTGLQKVNELNEKYKTDGFPKFHFFYRKRVWNPQENMYLGWERKRGLLTQFNEYILGNSKNKFSANTLEVFKGNIPKIKYIITLDADTELVLNSGLELIGAMAHILNRPIINNCGNLVIDGHALIQPRIGVDLTSVEKSNFTKIFAGSRRNRCIHECNFRCVSRQFWRRNIYRERNI